MASVVLTLAGRLAFIWASAAALSVARDLRPSFVSLLPPDLDLLSPPPRMGRAAFLDAVGAQLLLFGGFKPVPGKGWVRDSPAPTKLTDRVARIRPTWKSNGPVDYSLSANGSDALALFRVAENPFTRVQAGETVASLAMALEAKGLRVEDLEQESRKALRAMLKWSVPAAARLGRPSAVLAFSFDATPACLSLENCPLPGPSNELLAATIEHQWAKEGGNVEVYAQWEIAAALLNSGKLPKERIHPAGTPGGYQNTAQIFEAMLPSLAQQQPAPEAIAVLAHPDHLRRAFLTVQSSLGPDSPVRPEALVPAMVPLGLDWPANGEEGLALNLFQGVAGFVHTSGRVVKATWYSKSLGFFPDAEPQAWVHDREVWLLYDHWAVAQGLATKVLRPDAFEAQRR